MRLTSTVTGTTFGIVGAMTTPDNPSKSEVYGQFHTLSERLDNLDAHTANFSVSYVLDYPAQDIGYDIENDPAPWVGEWWGSWYYENTYVLIANQDAYGNGIYQFTNDPDNDPLQYVMGADDLPLGSRITSYASSVFSKPGPYEVVQDGAYEGIYAKWMGDLSVYTVYTNPIDGRYPALDSNGDPLLDSTGGNPVPILLTGQGYQWQNGIYWALPERLSFSQTLTWNGYNGGALRITTSLFAENGDLGNTGWFWINDPSLGHPCLWRQM